MARKQQALSYLPFTLTQGSADAFVQVSIATALSGLTKTSYRMASLELEIPKRVVSDGSDYQISLTRKSYSAMPTSQIVEKSMIKYWRETSTSATAAGFMVLPRTLLFTWGDDDAPIIVEDPIYAQLDSASTSVANVVYGRIGYWQDSISEVDRLTLIANSLS